MTENELLDRLSKARDNINHFDSLQEQVNLLAEFVCELKTAGLQQKSEVDVTAKPKAGVK